MMPSGARIAALRLAACAAVAVEAGPASLLSGLLGRKRPDVVTSTGGLPPVGGKACSAGGPCGTTEGGGTSPWAWPSLPWAGRAREPLTLF